MIRPNKYSIRYTDRCSCPSTDLLTSTSAEFRPLCFPLLPLLQHFSEVMPFASAKQYWKLQPTSLIQTRWERSKRKKVNSSTAVLPAEASTQLKRSVQHVLSIAQRGFIVRWMVRTVEEEGELHIASKAVSHFHQRFRGKVNANLTKASRIWKDRSKYLLRMDRNGRSF